MLKKCMMGLTALMFVTMVGCATTKISGDPQIPTQISITVIKGKFQELKCTATFGKVITYKGQKYCAKRLGKK